MTKSIWTNLPEGYVLRGDHGRVTLVAPSGAPVAARAADLEGTLELAELAWAHAWQVIREEVRAELSAVSAGDADAPHDLKRLPQFVRLLEALAPRASGSRRAQARKPKTQPSRAVPST